MTVSPSIKVTPLTHSAGFGAEIHGIDLNNLDQPTFEALERALYTYKLLIVRDQADLLPKKQLELVKRLDPNTTAVHGHGDAKAVMKGFKGQKSLVGANPAVPDEPMVRMLGRTTIQPGHHGVEEPITLNAAGHTSFHRDPLSDEEIQSGVSRFMRWHIDAAFYGNTHPPRVTTLWAHTMPEGKPDLTVRWDDGSNDELKSQPGRTAFLDCTQMYNNLSVEDKSWVDHSRVLYAPSPYQWIQNAKAMGNGLNMVSEGLETPFDELPNSDPALQKEYPIVWINPYNGEKALQVHGIIVQKLFRKYSADGPEEVIEDVAQIRDIFYKLQRPFFVPANVIMSPQGSGDMAMWCNRLCRHSAIDLPLSAGDRLCHQVHVTGSDNPAFPDPVQATTTA